MSAEFEQSRKGSSRTERATRLSAIFVIFVGFVGVIGWLTGNVYLLRVLPELTTMPFNTALLFVCAGFGLLAAQYDFRRGALICALALSFTSASFLFEYAVGLDLGIDQLLMKVYLQHETAYPGRPVPNTALSFFFAGLSLIVITLWANQPRMLAIGGTLSLFILTLGGVGFLEYVVGNKSGYGWVFFNRMSIHTAIGLMVLAIGLIDSVWHRISLQQLNIKDIRQLLLIYSSTGALLIAVVSSASAVLPFYNRLVQVEMNELLHDAQLKATMVASFWEHIRAEVLQVTARMQARQRLESLEKGELSLDAYQVQTKPILEEALRLSSEIKGITRVSNHGDILVSVGLEVPMEKLSDEMRKREEFWLSPPMKINHEILLVANAPIVDMEQKQIGTDIMLVRPNALVKALMDQTEVGRDINFILGVLQAREVHVFSAKGFLAGSPLDDYSGNPLVSAGFQAAHRGHSGILNPDVRRKIPVLVAYAPVGKQIPGWSMVAMAEGNRVYADIDGEMIMVVVSIFVLTLLGTSGMILLVRPLTGEVFLRSRMLQVEVAKKTLELEMELFHRKETEKALREQAEQLVTLNLELKESNKELDNFAYLTSHDLKEPLRGIHNYSSFLLEDYADKLGDDGKKKLQTITRLTQAMESLIESLLYYSRVGRVDLAVSEVDLYEVVTNMLESLQIVLEESHIDVRLPKRLPRIKCDRVRVGEIFRNLVTNAIKYNDKAEKWIEIGFHKNDLANSTVCTGEENVVIFYVRDNGIGIKERHLAAIFGMFKRLHGRDRYGGGTGIGLCIAKKLVERHGGQIWVESIFGEGTTFYFTLESQQGNIIAEDMHHDEHAADSSC